MNTLNLAGWKTPAGAYPRATLGRARIGTHYWGKDSYYELYGEAPPGEEGGYAFARVDKRLRITDLRIDGEVVMVDDPAHWYSIQRHARTYSGHILVAGLGLGLIVHALRRNPAVTRITVVEREADVIALVGPLVPGCEIVHSDWYDYTPDFAPDGVFFDLFVGDGRELFGQAILTMAKISRRHPDIPVRILGFNLSEARQTP